MDRWGDEYQVWKLGWSTDELCYIHICWAMVCWAACQYHRGVCVCACETDGYKPYEVTLLEMA